MNQFVYGTQYLRGLSPRPEDWNTDLRRIRELGFNTIRAWLVWNIVEPAEGKLNKDYLDRFLDLTVKHGLNVGLLFHLNGAPEWVTRKYPHCLYVSDTERIFEPSSRSNTPSGGWPGLCYDWPEVQEVTESFIARVVDHVSDRKNIAFWEPMNEPHVFYDSDTNEFFCHCPASRTRFVGWMKKKYGTLSKVSEAWGRLFNTWDEIRPSTWNFGYADVIDYRLFLEDDLAEELERRTRIIREHDRNDRPVIGHSYGSNTSREDLASMAFDDWKNAAVFDKWGYSGFPQTYRDNMGVAMSTVTTLAAAKGKEIWQSELGTGDNGVGIDRHKRARKEELAGWIWESIAHGAKGLLHWQYRKEIYGSEIGAFGLTEYDGEVSENGEETSRICNLLQKHADVFNHAAPPAAEVGLVFSKLSWMIEWCQIWRPELRKNKVSRDCLAGYFRMFWEENIPVSILHEDFVSAEDLRKHKLIILPMPVGLSENLTKLLPAYIREGGVVLSDPYFCAFDGKQWLSRTVPGRGFDAIFGCEEKEIDSQNIRDVKLTMGKSRGTINRSHFLETFKVGKGKVIARYANGEAAMIENRHGNGRAILSGLNLGLTYASSAGVGEEGRRSKADAGSTFAKKIVMNLVSDLGVSRPVQTDKPDVTANLLYHQAGGDDILVVINQEDCRKTVNVKISKKYAKVLDLVEDKERPLASRGIKMTLANLEARVFRLRK